MLDLIFVINSKESKKIGLPVLETYLCKNIINKSGKYGGGIIHKININEIQECNNISQKEIETLKKFLKKYGYNISLYQYLLNYHDIKELFNMINGKK